MGYASYVQEGVRVDYTPESAVAAGDVVVVGDFSAVADRAIAAGEVGALAFEGVYDVPKTAGASTAIALGTKLYWDATAKVATATATDNSVFGRCVKAAVDADTKVRVRLSRS